MRQSANLRRRLNSRCRGFSLVEAMIAVVVLSVGVLSLARLVPFATRTDYNARTDSTATFVAMREMEQMLAQPWSTMLFVNCGTVTAPCFFDAKDDAGLSSPVSLACTCGAAPCTGGNVGAPFVAGTETINFTAGPVTGYRRLYTISQSTTAGTVKVNQGVYDVRWHITCNQYGIGGAGFWKITVAARPVGNLPGVIAIPAHVQSVKMK